MKSISLFLLFAIIALTAAQFGGFGGFGGGGDDKKSKEKGSGSGGGGGGGGGFGLPGLSQLPALPKLPDLPGSDMCSIFALMGGGLADDAIKAVCNMGKNWVKGVTSIGSGKGDGITGQGGLTSLVPQYRMTLTDKQMVYWDYVDQCRADNCICKYWPKCRNAVADIAAGKTQNISVLYQLEKRYGKATRKEIRAMTDVDRHRYFYAMNKLNFDKIDNKTKYEILTGNHLFVPFLPSAHFSASFLPFHRELLKVMEVALRMEHPLAAFPYWDSTLDNELPNPRDTVLFSNELLGQGSGNVSEGPFGRFTGNSPEGAISRAVGTLTGGMLLRKEYIDIILAKPIYQMLVFCTDPFLDTVHAAVHIYIGGLMQDPATSPGDPLFYLHHGMMDYIFELWRQKNQDRSRRESELGISCPYILGFDFPENQLFPFSCKVKDAYSNIYTDYFYEYQEGVSCKNNCHDSKYLTCNKKTNRCISKVTMGGLCGGYEDIDICYKGKCKNGQCAPA